MDGRISRTTRNLYELNMRTLVSPAFDRPTLREIGVARCDRFIKELGTRSHNRAKHARVVLRLALELAVRHEVLTRNPMDHVSRHRRQPHIPDALTASEVSVVRAAIARWEGGADHVPGPLPEGQLGAIVAVMLGTRPESARCGHQPLRRRHHQRRAVHPPHRNDRQPQRQTDLPARPLEEHAPVRCQLGFLRGSHDRLGSLVAIACSAPISVASFLALAWDLGRSGVHLRNRWVVTPPKFDSRETSGSADRGCSAVGYRTHQGPHTESFSSYREWASAGFYLKDGGQELKLTVYPKAWSKGNLCVEGLRDETAVGAVRSVCLRPISFLSIC
jgi:hypothetical protein